MPRVLLRCKHWLIMAVLPLHALAVPLGAINICDVLVEPGGIRCPGDDGERSAAQLAFDVNHVRRAVMRRLLSLLSTSITSRVQSCVGGVGVAWWHGDQGPRDRWPYLTAGGTRNIQLDARL